MRSKSDPNVWAIGDCASIPDPAGKPDPQLAQHALREAKVLARNITAVLRGKGNLEPFVYETLGKRFELVKPDGAFYIFPKAPAGMSATDFVTKAIERNVLIIPGNVFSERDTHFRISYATTDEKLKQGCEILNALAG